jgi:hypothetical protein
VDVTAIAAHQTYQEIAETRDKTALWEAVETGYGAVCDMVSL